ncbi:hypothetical protein CRG49_002125 [Neisseria sp. N95_16]|uniref:Uncharacterized protein n=1 Tax=Neisseria brasiliensis TaxID=2666100 RepID=A0A7X2KYW4_9NEIS|nr:MULTISPECIES: hypothetical protein [Neisseria]MRN38583.1 hypothetical protein [Neisseria brasiliensis]PJO10502.1 hypothetical protein CRG49_002125 [Neisseria sp. N95_16]
MKEQRIYTSPLVELFDAVEHSPPKEATKLLVLSKYGILGLGSFDSNFHVAWGYLPKIPKSVKERMSEGI